jgi:hypothetical protein
MEAGSKQSISTFRKLIFIVLIVFVVITLLYLCLLVIGTRAKIESVNNEFGINKSKANSINEKLYSNPEFIDLQKEKAFLQARIKMAESDSICLSLNLKDSIAALEINGAPVYSAHISRIGLSGIFKKVNEHAITGMLSAPLEVRESFATIKKEPILIKMAPKDTIEANVPNVLPDTSSFEPVNFILVMNNGFKLYVYQEEEKKASDRRSLFLFDLKDRLRYAKAAFRNIITFKTPEYQPYIKIRLPKDNAKIIYRAIPRKGMVSVYK